MASKLDLSVFNFSTEEIRQINELVMEEVLLAPDINLLHTIYPGIVTDKYVGFIGEGGLVGVAEQGCDPQVQAWKASATQHKWQPKGWEVFLNECYTDIENSMAIYAMNKGVDKADLTNTDYMAVIVEVLAIAIRKMVWRLIWFSDTDAANYSDMPAGIITDGVDVKYFNILDGLWKQVMAAVTTVPERLVALAANTQASTAAQFSNMTGVKAYEALNNLYMRAPITLRGASDSFFACTQSFADAYMSYLEGKELESTYKNIVDGVNGLSFRGKDLIPMPIWDEIIARYENNGTKLNNPHRCLFTTKRNLAVGTPSSGVLEDLDVWYDKKERKNYIFAADAIDTKLLSTDMFMLAI